MNDYVLPLNLEYMVKYSLLPEEVPKGEAQVNSLVSS